MTCDSNACLNPIRPEDSIGQAKPVLEGLGGNATEEHLGKEEKPQTSDDGEERSREEEVRKPKPAARPYTPTKEEIREHEVTHLPFRPWCRHCVFGKGVRSPHLKSDDKEKIGTTISMDYCFMADDEEEGDLPGVLVIWDDNHECLWALPVDKKGPVDWVVKWIVNKLDSVGYKGSPLTLKSDQEPAITALKMAIAATRVGHSTPIESPVRESASNGAAERAIRSWQGQMRTMKSQFEANIGMKLPIGHPLIGWLVLWSGEVMLKYVVSVGPNRI